MSRAVEEIEVALAEFLSEHGSALGLGTGPFSTSYVANPGGFMNANFTVRSGTAAWHCKLAHPETRHELYRCWELREPLRLRYHSPEALAWFDLDDVGRGGAIFEHVEGRRASHTACPEVWPVVSSSLEELRRDPELRASLHPGRAPRPCSEFLEATSLAMLEADIGETRVHAHCPPFIEAHFWEWATDQVEEIRRLAKRSAAFHVPADSVVHGDLWEGNVLVGPDRWWIVDWDDLDLGDPAKDRTDWWWNVRSLPQPADRALAARLPLWQRARLLVEAVDPLADWAEAVVAPDELRQSMRDAARDTHRVGLARYLDRYPPPDRGR